MYSRANNVNHWEKQAIQFLSRRERGMGGGASMRIYSRAAQGRARAREPG